MRRSLIVAGLIACAAALLVGFGRARRETQRFFFRVELASDVRGRVQVYYDLGHGLSEADSASAPVNASRTPVAVALPLPEGEYHTLRFDPINAPGTVRFAHPRITTSGDRVVREFAAKDFAPNDNVAAFDAAVPLATLRTAPGRDDPNLTLDFPQPLVLRSTTLDRLRAEVPAMLAAFVGAFAGLVAIALLWRRRGPLAAAARRRPQAVLWVIAAAAGIAASYPVVFCGKSFVSPNTTPLLRQSPPTVPGYDDLRTTNLHVNDPAVVMWQNVPYGVAESRAVLHDHELPLWDRFVSCGTTLIGQGQSMLGDPVHLLVIAAGGASWAWDTKFVLAKILFAAGLALTIWLLTADFAAAAIIAIAAPFVAFYNFRFNHPAVFSVSYAPWILAAWALLLRAADVRRLRGGLALLVIANVAVLGSGTVKEAYALLLVLNAVGVAWWLMCGRDAPTPRDAISGPPRGVWAPRPHAVAIALAIVCGLAIAAPLWLPFVETLRTAYTAYEKPVVWQAPRAWLVGLFDSLFFVELNPRHLGFLPSANFLILLGVVFAVIQSPRRLARSAQLWILLLALVGSVVLAYEFVPARWIAATPLLRNIYHVHNTFSVVAVVLLGALAGCGFHVARARLREPHPWRPVLIGGGLLLLLLVIYFHDLPSTWMNGAGIAGWARGVERHLFFYVNLVLMLTSCAALIAVARRRLRFGRTSAGAAVIAVLAVAVLLYRHGLHADFGFAEDYLTFPMVRADLGRPSPAIEAARAAAGAEPFRMIGTDTNLINGWNTVYGVESINGPDAMVDRRYRELAEATGLAPTTDWRFPVSPAALAQDRPVLDFLGVRFVLSDATTLPAGSGYTKLGSYDLELYRSATAWPRAFFVDQVQHYATAPDFAALIRSRAGQPFAAIQTGDTAAESAVSRLALGFASTAAPAVPARDYRLTADTTAFSVSAPGAGVVVLQETWLPDSFDVTVNGVPAAYFRVNHAFKAIALPRAGDYRIIFRYWPPHFTLALWLSAAGFVGLIALLAAPRLKQRSVAPVQAAAAETAGKQ